MAADPIVLLSGPAGRTFIESGLVVIRETHDRLFSERHLSSNRDILNNITIHHEWVHYLQSITCASVHHTAQQLLCLSVDAVVSAAKGGVADSTHAQIRELSERLYGRRSDDAVKIIDRPGQTIMIPIPESDQIGMLDLLEGVAVLESFKLCTQNGNVEHFLAFRDQYFPGNVKNVYRRSFDWLASSIAAEAAYELLAPVSFLALQTNKPEAEFVRIANLLSKEKNLDYRALTEVQELARLAYEDGWSSWLHGFEKGEPEAGHVTLDPCITFCVGKLGVATATQLGATPSRVTRELFESEAVAPPVTAYSGLGEPAIFVSNYARGDLAAAVLDWTALVGAAERLTTLAETDPYQFCRHSSCPHFDSVLCHRYFAPPSSDHKICRFPRMLHKVADMNPNDLWSAVGRDRKSVADLVAAFEEVGECNIWALARRQRASIVAWLGEEAYNNLEWKCRATAEKALRALQTQRVDDVAEAKWFRNSVINEIRGLVSETAQGPKESQTENLNSSTNDKHRA
jgi:hypothetical protein